MKIAVHDHVRKFSSDLIDHWKKNHEVKWEMYWNPALTHWANTTFIDFVDNSLVRASNPNDELWQGNQAQGKNIIARMHDIDAWCEHYKKVNWDWVNHLVFVADHIRDMVVGKYDFPKTLQIHTIKHGINLDKFTLKDKPRGNKIAWVGRMVHHKCLELALQVLAENPEYELHVAGSSLDGWEKAYVNSFVKRNNLKFFYYGQIPHEKIDRFYEDKSYLLLTSFKEAFSFAVGEGMARGLKPLIHNFWGAEGVWDTKYIWNRVSEVKPMLEGEYNPKEYRDYIKKHYPLDKMVAEYDKII